MAPLRHLPAGFAQAARPPAAIFGSDPFSGSAGVIVTLATIERGTFCEAVSSA
jgi:hypothetical protein